MPQVVQAGSRERADTAPAQSPSKPELGSKQSAVESTASNVEPQYYAEAGKALKEFHEREGGRANRGVTSAERDLESRQAEQKDLGIIDRLNGTAKVIDKAAKEANEQVEHARNEQQRIRELEQQAREQLKQAEEAAQRAEALRKSGKGDEATVVQQRADAYARAAVDLIRGEKVDQRLELQQRQARENSELAQRAAERTETAIEVTRTVQHVAVGAVATGAAVATGGIAGIAVGALAGTATGAASSGVEQYGYVREGLKTSDEALRDFKEQSIDFAKSSAVSALGGAAGGRIVQAAGKLIGGGATTASRIAAGSVGGGGAGAVSSVASDALEMASGAQEWRDLSAAEAVGKMARNAAWGSVAGAAGGLVGGTGSALRGATSGIVGKSLALGSEVAVDAAAGVGVEYARAKSEGREYSWEQARQSIMQAVAGSIVAEAKGAAGHFPGAAALPAAAAVAQDLIPRRAPPDTPVRGIAERQENRLQIPFAGKPSAGAEAQGARGYVDPSKYNREVEAQLLKLDQEPRRVELGTLQELNVKGCLVDASLVQQNVKVGGADEQAYIATLGADQFERVRDVLNKSVSPRTEHGFAAEIEHEGAKRSFVFLPQPERLSDSQFQEAMLRGEMELPKGDAISWRAKVAHELEHLKGGTEYVAVRASFRVLQEEGIVPGEVHPDTIIGILRRARAAREVSQETLARSEGEYQHELREAIHERMRADPSYRRSITARIGDLTGEEQARLVRSPASRQQVGDIAVDMVEKLVPEALLQQISGQRQQAHVHPANRGYIHAERQYAVQYPGSAAQASLTVRWHTAEDMHQPAAPQGRVQLTHEGRSYELAFLNANDVTPAQRRQLQELINVANRGGSAPVEHRGVSMLAAGDDKVWVETKSPSMAAQRFTRDNEVNSALRNGVHPHVIPSVLASRFVEISDDTRALSEMYGLAIRARG